MRTTVKFLLLVTVFRPVNEDSFVVNPLDVQFLDEKARYDNENYLVKDGMLRRKKFTHCNFILDLSRSANGIAFLFSRL